MKKTATIIFLLLASLSKAQLFTGVGGPIQNNGQETFFKLVVSGLNPAQLNSSFGIEEVCVEINHPVNQELYIYLKSPDGKIVQLNRGNSSKGANYTSTCFDSKLNNSITMGNPPYSGSYRPVGYLGRFNNGQTGNGTWNLIVKDYLAFVNSGSLSNWSIKFGNSPSAPVVFASSNLPIVIIKTNNQIITDQEIVIDMGIIDNGPGQRNLVTDPWNNYSGKAVINLRGMTSQNFEKKSYSFETHDAAGIAIDASLLNMPAESDWTLIASYVDKTLIRNPITHDLFRKMGHYSSRFRNVEVILDGEYIGVYALMEKPKRGKDRIDISKLAPDENTDPAITGGYILKIDRPDEPGWYSLLPGNSPTQSHFYYENIYPKDADISIPQRNYIKNFMNDFETLMNSSSYAHPVNGYSKYLDVESFIDYFILTELNKNVDGYRLSTYLYKDNIKAGGKLHIGPVWDYDLAWHNCNYGAAMDFNGWEFSEADADYPSPTWWKKFLDDPNFKNQLYCRWTQLRKSFLANNKLYEYIDSSATALNESQQRNFTQYAIIGAYIYPNPQSQLSTNYQKEVADIKNWINNRAAWMDANISGICNTIGINKHELSNNSIHSYPNPFTNNLNFSYTIEENSTIKIELLNMIGDEVLLILNENKSSGYYQGEIATKTLAAGTYILKLTINERAYFQKIVKLKE